MNNRYSDMDHYEGHIDYIEDMRYYEVMHTTVNGLGMLVRYQVDGIDDTGAAVEIKLRKHPNPRYPLGT